MTSARKTAAALRDVADMVEELGLDCDLRVSVSDPPHGALAVWLEPGRELADHEELRPALDAVSRYVGAGLEASFSRGEFWSVGTPWQPKGRLPSEARVPVRQRLRGRPLDLEPLPRRRTRGTR